MERGLVEGRYRLKQQQRFHDLAVRRFGKNREDVRSVRPGEWEVKNGTSTHTVIQRSCSCHATVSITNVAL